MKNLTIIVPNGENNLSSITGTYEIFSRANLYWKNNTKQELFNIQLAGVSEQVDFNAGLFSVKPHTTIAEIAKTNLIILPSLNHNYELALKENEAWLPGCSNSINWVLKLPPSVPVHFSLQRPVC